MNLSLSILTKDFEHLKVSHGELKHEHHLTKENLIKIERWLNNIK